MGIERCVGTRMSRSIGSQDSIAAYARMSSRTRRLASPSALAVWGLCAPPRSITAVTASITAVTASSGFLPSSPPRAYQQSLPRLPRVAFHPQASEAAVVLNAHIPIGIFSVSNLVTAICYSKCAHAATKIARAISYRPPPHNTCSG